VPFTVYTWRLVNNGIVTSAGKYEYCTQAGNYCSFMDLSPTCPLLLLTRTQWIYSYSFSHGEQRARDGGLRIWIAQETECVLGVGWTWICLASVACIIFLLLKVSRINDN